MNYLFVVKLFVAKKYFTLRSTSVKITSPVIFMHKLYIVIRYKTNRN